MLARLQFFNQTRRSKWYAVPYPSFFFLLTGSSVDFQINTTRPQHIYITYGYSVLYLVGTVRRCVVLGPPNQAPLYHRGKKNKKNSMVGVTGFSKYICVPNLGSLTGT